MNTRTKIAIGLGLVLLLGGLLVVSCGQSVRRGLITALTPEYAPEGDPNTLKAEFDGLDADRDRIEIALTPAAEGFEKPVDIQFVPGYPSVMVVAQQTGKARWYDMETKKSGDLLQVDVLTQGEQGFLGLAFHPEYKENGRVFINYTAKGPKEDVTVVAEWVIEDKGDVRTTPATFVGKVLEVEQPYQNHNAGQLAFGPDGMLYVGLGDGGFADDPHGHGQNTGTMLGSMLRIDVDKVVEDGKTYAIPKDNPDFGEGALPEIWAIGLRNPWRYSFAPDGRLVVADVGQDKYEEITIVGKGENHGWKIREASHCFEPKDGCTSEGLVGPAYEYGREDGASITGGVVVVDKAVPALDGKYVFGDFITGRMWAIELPKAVGALQKKAFTLGRWPILISTFGRDASGQVYVADYASGSVLKLSAP